MKKINERYSRFPAASTSKKTRPPNAFDSISNVFDFRAIPRNFSTEKTVGKCRSITKSVFWSHFIVHRLFVVRNCVLLTLDCKTWPLWRQLILPAKKQSNSITIDSWKWNSMKQRCAYFRACYVMERFRCQHINKEIRWQGIPNLDCDVTSHLALRSSEKWSKIPRIVRQNCFAGLKEPITYPTCH